MRFALSILAGFLTAISMPGIFSGFLIWFSLIPLISAFKRSKPLESGLMSFIFFFTHLTISHFWLIDTLARNLPTVLKNYPPILGVLVFLLFGLYESIFMFPLGFLSSYMRLKNPIFDSMFIASLYTILEKLRELGDMGFTGGRLSDALVDYPGYLLITRFTGELGLVFLIVFVNSMMYHEMRRRNIHRLAFILLIVLLFPYISKPFIPPPRISNPVEVQVLQTSYDPSEKYSLSLTDTLKKIKPENDVIFIVPEAFYMGDPENVSAELTHRSSETGSLLILGALRLGKEKHNSAYYFSPDGRTLRYDKIKLFPFAEFLPYPKIFFFLSFLRGLMYYTPGSEYSVFNWNGINISTQICFESYFESVSRNMAKNGSEILFVITNDGWFRSKVALKQHFAKAVIRAAENGRWIVQVANKGITGVVDNWGRTILTLKIGMEMETSFPVQPESSITFYTKHPNLAVLISILILIGLILFKILRGAL